jgi:beta-galactosidase
MVLHVFPHWTWPGRDGETIDVWCYSNCDDVQLFLNGVSLGRKTMPRDSHLAWDVKYVPGMLEAHGYRGGKRVATKRIETTTTPSRLVLASERTKLRADGADVAAVTVSACDDANRFCPTADVDVTFSLTGAGRILGHGNGDPSDHTPHASKSRRLFNGLCQVLVQSSTTAGQIVLTARAGRLVETLAMESTIRRVRAPGGNRL